MRTVADIPPVLAAFTGAPMDSYDKTLDKAPRIGLVRGIEWDKATAPAQAAFEDAARRLAKAGASVRDVAIDPMLKTAHERSWIVTGYETARAYAYEWFNHRDGLSPAFERTVADDPNVIASGDRTEFRRDTFYTWVVPASVARSEMNLPM